MAPGSGVLQIRDAEEPYPLDTPTTFTGTVDDSTGEISGATFLTQPVSFETEAQGLPVFVIATFSQVTPGSGAGSINGDGNIVFRDSLTVDLDVKVGSPTILENHCVTSPVAIEMLSTTPYTEVSGGRIADLDFTIPEIPQTSECVDIVANGINAQLAGSGHSLTMAVTGDLPIPVPGDPTTTTLAASPADGARLGEDVTLTATVAPVETAEAPPTGAVTFLDGTRTVGTAPVVDGVATLVTNGLRPGSRSVAARYQGDTAFRASNSDVVTYLVAAVPTVEANIPDAIVRGADPVEFDVAATNPAGGRAVTNARFDVGIKTDTTQLSHVELERQDQTGAWVPVPLTRQSTPPLLVGTVGPPAGRPLAPGASYTDRLRLRATPSIPLGELTIAFDLQSVDPGTGDVTRRVAGSTGTMAVLATERIETTVDLYAADAQSRPGYSIEIQAFVNANDAPSGFAEILLDGRRVDSRAIPIGGPLEPVAPRQPVEGGVVGAVIVVPSDITTGTHSLTLNYLGDRSFLPSMSAPVSFEVLPPLGPRYACNYTSSTSAYFEAYIEASARVPASATAGETVSLNDLEMSLRFGGLTMLAYLGDFPAQGGRGIYEVAVDLDGVGTLTGDSVDYTPDYDSVDQVVDVQGLAGTVTAEGLPGEVVPVTVGSITLSGVGVAGQTTTVCEPLDDAVSLGDVMVVGAVLDVSAPEPTRVGDDVTLTATVAPPSPTGTVGFYDGSTPLGNATVTDGKATLVTDEMGEGYHSLAARYVGALPRTYMSAPVALTVLPAVDCAASAEEGSAAVVRLTYLELLGRCPDAAGLAFWTGELDDGVSSETFARRIAYSTEALGQVVDDGYQTILGRDADTAGRAYWVGRLQANGRYDQLLSDLAASNEFWVAAGSTNGGYVDLVYERVLDRPSDPDGRGYWLTQLYFGKSRRVMVTTFARLSEPLGRIVDGSFDEILGRVPTGTERTAAMSRLRTDGDRSGLYTRLIGTTEFFDRAQEFPNPED